MKSNYGSVGGKVKIADACIDLLKTSKFNFYTDSTNDSIVIIPYLDHEFCHDVLKYAGKKETKHVGWLGRDSECKRVANALENDKRFIKFIHTTGRRAFELYKFYLID